MEAKPVGAFSALNRTSKNGIATVNVFSESGQDSVEVKVNSTFEDADEPMLVDRLTDAGVRFVNLNNMLFTTSVIGPSFDLITPDAGGNSVGSIFSIGLLKIDGEKRLLLSLSRDKDPGSKTACFYWIVCPKQNEVTQQFKDTVKKCVSELISDGAYVLRQRAILRRSFNKIRTFPK